MRRDWPLVAAGFGVAAVSAAVLAGLALSYEPAPAPCEPPAPPAVLIDGCGPTRSGFGDWIGEPLVIAALAFAFVLLVIAAVTIKRGLYPRAQRSRA
jgi:hypothetical protein